MISLEWPWALALAALPLAVRRLLPPARHRGGVALAIGLELEGVAAGAAGADRWPPALVLAWIALVLAAAQPVWSGSAVPMPVIARDLVLALDLSASMAEKDVDPLQADRTRLEAARDLAADFLRDREGDRVGLVLFGTRAYLYAPLTLDRAAVAAMLGAAEVGLAGDATAVGDAIVAGIKALGGRRGGVMVLLTDGENTAGSVPPGKAAELAAASGLRIHTIGFGSHGNPPPVLHSLGVGGSPVQEAPLREISARTGGRYFRARSAAELADVYRQIDALEPVAGAVREFRPRRALFQWPLAASLLLMAFAAWPRWVRP
jgi:Ca-activated chloride channel homolog